MEDEQFTLTNMHSNEKRSQPSSQLPLGKYLVDIYALANGGHICPPPKKEPSQDEFCRMLSRPAKSWGRESHSGWSGEEENRVAASKLCQVMTGGIQTKEINQGPAPPPKAGKVLANGR